MTAITQLWQWLSNQLNTWNHSMPQNQATEGEVRISFGGFPSTKQCFQRRKSYSIALGSEHTSAIHKGNSFLSLKVRSL